MGPLSSWMLSSVRTRTWLMRSRISLTSLVRVDAPSMLLTNSAVCLSRRRRSSRVLLRAEATLEMEENRVLRSQLELANVRQEIDRRVAEKEEEFNNTRKNHARAMESLGASIEAEQRAKGEGLRIKKQLEGEINELEIGLDHANKANSEGLKSIKRYQTQLRETIQAFEDEARSRAQIAEQVGISERK